MVSFSLLTVQLLGVLVLLDGVAVFQDADLASIGSPQGFKMVGAVAGEEAGRSVSTAGDMNNDGFKDIIIGAWLADPVFGGTPRTDAGIVYVVFGKQGTSVANMDLTSFSTSSAAGFRIFGAVATGLCGYSVSDAGDVNGDGVSDIVVGAYASTIISPAREFGGASYVIFGRNIPGGRSPFSDIDLASFNTNPVDGFGIIGAGPGDQSGVSVGTAGDINGDNLADILVGSALADFTVGAATRTDAGIVYVVFGKFVAVGALATNVDLLGFDSPNAAGFRILGGASFHYYGASVSGGRDVNGDGRSDIIFGGSGADPGGKTGAGIVCVIFGRSFGQAWNDIDLATTTSSANLGYRVTGAASEDRFGLAVGHAGDINGDGIRDIIVGARNADPNISAVTRTDAGISYVIFGQGAFLGNVDTATFASTNVAGFQIFGAVGGDFSGHALSGAGDINNDGFDDIIIGAYSVDAPPIGATLRTNSGAAYVIFGRDVPGGAAAFTNIDLATFSSPTSQGFRILGAKAEDSCGAYVSLSGDMNNDGYDDIIVGANLAETANSGAAYVIFGFPYVPTSQPSSQPSRRPSRQPTAQPSCLPTSQPSRQPSSQPSRQPTRQPTARPSGQPTQEPSSQPRARPSAQPSVQPSARPSNQPTGHPSSQPSSQPSVQPSGQPSAQPTSNPSRQPTSRPTVQPSLAPSSQPTCQPSAQPSNTPSGQPSLQPTVEPSMQPTTVPSTQPTQRPSRQPTSQPSARPSARPSSQPLGRPSALPSRQPTGQPSAQPSDHPTCQPSTRPSSQPTVQPTSVPSAQPSALPSCRPTAQPTARPSGQPTLFPSSVPTCQPSKQPTSVPSCQPSSQPSAGPSGQPSGGPSAQPSRAPTDQPTSRPTSSPSSQPSVLPSMQPSAQPTFRPSAQPSRQPSSTPSCQPSAEPSARPSRAPTGEWVTDVSTAVVSWTEASTAQGTIWACGVNNITSSAICLLADPVTGTVLSQYQLDWTGVTSVLSTEDTNSVVLSGTSESNAVKTNEVATCTMNVLRDIQCQVVSYYDSTFLAATFVPYPNKVVYIGLYNIYASITIADVATSNVQSYMYTATNMKPLHLSHAHSPPYFFGSFVAGTTIRATAAPVNYIVAGMVRTEAGILRAMVLMPQSGDIVNSAGLVNAMALENTGPDSFIAGALHLDDSTQPSAYLFRVNALFMTVQYCVRYRSLATGRRALSAGADGQSAVNGVVFVGANLFMIVASKHNNGTMTLLKTDTASGMIVKQVHVQSANASMSCTDITLSGLLLRLVCNTHGRSAAGLQSWMISVNQDLSFTALPPGFYRSEDVLFQEEIVPFKRTVLNILKIDTTIATSRYDFSTAGQGPTRRPSLAPSYAPSVQPSSAPSAQPSSSPTAAPTVSARPTSQPSSAVPTNTHKPTATPTLQPTLQPSVSPSVRPTHVTTTSPSAVPSAPPSPQSTVQPSPVPSARPTRLPSMKPTSHPSKGPTVLPSRAPTATSSTEEGMQKTSSNDGRLPGYVVDASVGGGLLLLLVGYALYKCHKHNEEEKQKDLRRIDYYLKQAALCDKAKAEWEEYVRRDAEQAAERKAEKAKKEERRAAWASQTPSSPRRGAYAFGPEPKSPPMCETISNDGSVAINCLHSIEIDQYYAEYMQAQPGSRENVMEEGSGSAMRSSEYSDFVNEFMNEFSDGEGDFDGDETMS